MSIQWTSRGVALPVASLVLAFGAAEARAGMFSITYGVCESCTNNDAGDVAIGMAQLFVEVIDSSPGFVDFKFTNVGPLASSIADIYFDDGSLLGISTIINGPGTSFSQGASPGNLPGGNNCDPAFVTTAGFSADSDPPVQPNGVNPGEMVTIRFSLVGGQTFADVIDEISGGTLRIGIHVQGFSSGGSEGFVFCPDPVPAPAAFGMLGILGVAALRRRR